MTSTEHQLSASPAVAKLLSRQMDNIMHEVDLNDALSALWNHFNTQEQLEITTPTNYHRQWEVLIDLVKQKPAQVFQDLCSYLEAKCPKLLSSFVMDGLDSEENSAPTRSLQLSLELTLKERDNSLRECSRAVEERDELRKKLEQLQQEYEAVLAENHNAELLETSLTDRDYELGNGMNGHLDVPEKLGLIESEIIDRGTDKVVWETHRVTLERVQRFGFGIAVSGGRDNPHFTNGDPSIAISDVLKEGPAEHKLQINDRVQSVNGILLENVEHATAIALLKDSGNTVDLVIRRKITIPNALEGLPIKVTLNKKNKRDDYGIVLGCKYYIREIGGNSLASLDGSVREGDAILKINNVAVESISLMEARRQIEKSRDKLHLTIRRPQRAPSVTNLLHKRQNSDVDYSKTQSYKADNVYHHSSVYQKPEYEKPSINAFVCSTEALSPNREAEISPLISTPLATATNQSVFSPSKLERTSSVQRKDIPHRHHRDRSKEYQSNPMRSVSYMKEGGAGLRIAGGNVTGIFIAGVQEGSPAQREGVQEGDEILKIGSTVVQGMTREEAVLMILNLTDRVDLVLQNSVEEFRRQLAMVGTDSGDNFFIKAHMSYEPPKGSNHLALKPGDMFRVFDTLKDGVVGEWSVIKLGPKYEETLRGVIPNRTRAEYLAHLANGNDADKLDKGRPSIFKRKHQRRSKSLSKDHWDDVIFSKDTVKWPVYERVILKQPGFLRPVILFGPLADVCREKLVRDQPEKFDSPQTENEGSNSERGRSGIITLDHIRSVLDRGKHCVLDVTPSAVDKLNYAQYFPIVVNMPVDTKELVKDLRTRWAKGSNKNCKKLFDQSQKIDKYYQHLFTASFTLAPHDNWFQRLKDCIQTEQLQPVWMSEERPTEDVSNIVLFPMANRLSSSSSPEGDLDHSKIVHENGDRSALARASSDPNLAKDDADSNAYSQSTKYNQTVNGASAHYHSYSIPVDAGEQQGAYVTPAQSRRRSRITSDSRVPYASVNSKDKDGFDSVERGHTHSVSEHKHRSRTSPDKSHDTLAAYVTPNRQLYRSSTDYMSEHSSHKGLPSPLSPSDNAKRREQPHDPYKFTRMSQTGSFSKIKPPPPVRTDSMVSASPTAPAESPYARGMMFSERFSSSHGLAVSASHDNSIPVFEEPQYTSRVQQEELKAYNPARRHHSVQPSTGSRYSANPNQPPSTAPDSRTGHHYMSSAARRSRAQTADDSVFYATPVGHQTAFSNQVYMDSKEAQSAVIQKQESSKPAFNYEMHNKKLSSSTAFPAGHRVIERTLSADVHTPPSAFESYRRQTSDSQTNYQPGRMTSNRPGGVWSHKTNGQLSQRQPYGDLEPTPEDHMVLDYVSDVFDSRGGQLISRSTGVSLLVPPNALPHGVKESIYFKVCQKDPAVMPQPQQPGETTLSPLVICGPPGLLFQTPVELRLPHGKAVQSDTWRFSVKSADDTGESGWRSVDVSSLQLDASSNDCITVHVEHF